MLIEKFEVYKFKNVFYTKEELEELGFVYLATKEDYQNIKDVKGENYEITEKSPVSETLHSIEELLTFNEDGIIDKFFIDFGTRGLILGVDKYYGIKCKNVLNKSLYNEEMIQLFRHESDCDRAYKKVKKGITSYFDELAKEEPFSYVEDSKLLVSQNAEKETRMYVLNLINKNTKE